MAVADPVGVIAYLNPIAACVLGVDEGDADGRSIFEVWTDPASLNALRAALYEADSSVLAAKFGCPAEDDRREFEGHVTSVEGEAPGARMRAIVLRDVTPARRTAEALRSHEERLRQTYDRVQVGIAETDLDGRILLANSRLCEILGRPREELVEHEISEFSAPEDVAKQRILLRQMLSGEVSTYSMPKRYIRPDGQIEWVELTVSLVHDAGGSPVSLIGFALDISEHRRLVRELEFSERRLQLAVDAARIGIWESNVSAGDLTLSNLTRVHMGFTPEESSSLAALDKYVHADDLSMIRSSIARAVREGRPFEFEFRTSSYDGRNRWILSRGTALYEESGEPDRIIGVTLDVTVQKRAEMALRDILERQVAERTEELERTNRDLESFCYTVSHDLRAPLRGIIAASTVLMREFGDSLDAAAFDHLKRQASAAHKMGVLIDELLHLARIGRQEVVHTQIDASTLCRDILDELAPADAEIGVEPDLVVYGDLRLVRLAFQSLFENAVRFVEPGNVPHIEVRSAPDGAIEIRDRGIGFEMRYVQRIFMPFERLVSDAEYPGTGCGLANVKKVMERHAGQVWATSEPGRGSSFFLRFGPPS